MKLNSHITEYIDHYTDLQKPGYALLITGPWGCGKTYFIDRYIEKNKTQELKFIKVSLFGLQSIQEIEDKFFQILSPVLSNKYVVFGGRLTKALLNTIKFDIGEDNKATISSDISKVGLFKKIPEIENTVIVFDDLERCSINTVELMGYINAFVEKEGYKVILIAAENILDKLDEMKSLMTTFSSYSQTKEKLIGKTLEITPNIINVINLMINEFDKELKELFVFNQTNIAKIFNCSNYKNLRSLKKALEDFKRLWGLLDNEIRGNQTLMQDLIIIFMILSFEFYSGEIKGKEFKEIIGGSNFIKRVTSDLNEKSTNEDSKYKIISGKYEDFALVIDSSLLPVNLWSDYFEKGYISANDVNKQLRVTKYFDDIPAWTKLWSLYSLEEKEFKNLLNQVKTKFNNREYCHQDEIRHISGIFLHLIKNGIQIDLGKLSLVEELKLYIDDIAKKNKFEIEKIDWFDEHQTGYLNLSFYEHESDEFKEISHYLNQKTNESYERQLKLKSCDILKIMVDNTDDIYSLLTHTIYESGKYESTAILHLIDINVFFKTFMSLPNCKRRIVADAIYKRYRIESFNKNLIDELDWCNRLIVLLEIELKKVKNTFPSLVLKEGIEKIKYSITILKKSIM